MVRLLKRTLIHNYRVYIHVSKVVIVLKILNYVEEYTSELVLIHIMGLDHLNI